MTTTAPSEIAEPRKGPSQPHVGLCDVALLRSVPFEQLFLVPPMEQALRRVNLSVLLLSELEPSTRGYRLHVGAWSAARRAALAHGLEGRGAASARGATEMVAVVPWTPGSHEGWRLSGWRTYKYGCPYDRCPRPLNSSVRGPWRVAMETALLSGLVPVPRLQARADALRARLCRGPRPEEDAATAGVAVGGERSEYGCIHARIVRAPTQASTPAQLVPPPPRPPSPAVVRRRSTCSTPGGVISRGGRHA